MYSRRSSKDFMLNLYYFSRKVLDLSGGDAILYYNAVYSAGKEYLSLNTSKKAERTKDWKWEVESIHYLNRITNKLAILFMLLVMLYTLRWSHKPCMRNIIFLALAIGLGMSSKLSVAYMAPATALVFLWKLLHTRGWICSLWSAFWLCTRTLDR